MKQIGLGVAFFAGLAALGALYLLGPVSPMQVSHRSVEDTPPIPKGSGFDFYVLALSWSPTYCQEPSARSRDSVQCAGPRPFAFVVHGLWPQFEQGYPRACQTRERRPSQELARNMLDIMPSERLVQHEWDNHGACSGLSAPDFYSVTRSAAQRITIPNAYTNASTWQRVRAANVEAAFIAANDGMSPDGIAITKRGNNLSEVRICLTLDLKPRACPQVDSQGVKPDVALAMPPSRG